MRTLHLSLGHNASAVLTQNGDVVRGYEQERLDRKKGSSFFPALAINEALSNEDCDDVFISHWRDDFDPAKTETKHYSASFMLRRFPPSRVYAVGGEGKQTHHDAHARSVRAFFKAHTADHERPYVTIVCDGFGTRQECLSVYRDGRLVHRTYGYSLSLGLMYQYTTGWLGMKENEDEYKLLGYEVGAREILGPEQARTRAEAAHADGRLHAQQMLRASVEPYAGGLDASVGIDLQALDVARLHWHNRAQAWWELAGKPSGDRARRSVVALQAQSYLEGALAEIVATFVEEDDDLLLAGGVFYNVKLNNAILNMRRGGRLCVHPLSGDQGAALGLGDIPHGGLCWGDRVLDPHEVSLPNVILSDEAAWPGQAIELLERNRIVSVVRGRAEYGPRALCNTSTLAVPTRRNVAVINALNDRNDVMPMAPVILEERARDAFFARETMRVVGSNHYMVITHEVRADDFPDGVTHPDPTNPFRRTARPQIVPKGYDPALEKVLDALPHFCLINTSYNFHGQPIVHTAGDAIETHRLQCQRARALGLSLPYLILVRS